jgi:hypothetical protein
MAAVNGLTNVIKEPAFTLKNVNIENQRPIKVIVIGAGFSGILAAIRSVTCSDSLISVA